MRYSALTCLFINLLNLSVFTLRAEVPSIEQISTQQGLSQNTVRCILQDRKGFLWFGTLNGLNRYDGYRFVVYKTVPGKTNTLSDNKIKELYEDNHGFIWLKTFSNKFSCFDPVTETFLNIPNNQSSDSTYDGFYMTRSGDIWISSLKNGGLFLTFRNNQWSVKKVFSQTYNNQSIANNRVYQVFEDSNENVWLCTRGGISLVSRENIKNQKFTIKNFFSGKNAIDIIQAYQLGESVYFISRSNGVFSFNLTTNTFRKSEGITTMTVLSTALFNSNEIFIGTSDNGLLLYNRKTNRVSKSVFFIDERPNYITQLVADKCGGLWVSNTTGNIWRIDSINGSVNKFELIPNELKKIIDNERFIVYGSNHNVWITSYSGGLFCYRTQDKSMKHYAYEIGKSNVISSNYLLSIYCDRSGIVWVGAEHTGVNKLTFQENTFQTIYPSLNADLISSNNVKAIFEDRDGMVWVSTKDGKLHLYDANMQTLDHKNNPVYANISSNVYCFCQDKQGYMWLGTKGDGIYRLDPKQPGQNFIRKYKNKPLDPNSLSQNQVYDIVQDREGRIWAATFGGGLNLIQYDQQGNASFSHFFNNETYINQIRCLKLDRNGNLWMGTNYGAFCFNPASFLKDNGNFKHFVTSQHALSSSEVKTIFEDKSGQIWIGTSSGLNKYVPANSKTPEHFEVFTSRQGLSNDNIQGIIDDNEGNLWIGTENGISKLNTRDYSFENYRFSNNILGNLMSEAACFKRKNGEMLWGSANGFYSFSPAQFMPNRLSPPVVLTNFSISGNPIEVNAPESPLQQSITYTHYVQLDYNQHSFSIEFSTLMFNELQHKQYSYILENYEKEWNQLVNYNIATYRNLPPGKYTFKVKESKNNQVTSLQLTVLPPFWRSKFALSLYAFTFLLVFFSTKLVMKRIHKLQHVIELEKQLTEYKVKFFTNISHEFRTPLFLIQGSMEAILESIKLPASERKHFKVMHRNTNRLLMLIDQLLDFSKVQNKSMKVNLQETDVVDFLQEIYGSFSDLALKKHIDYQFSSNLEKSVLFIDQAIVDKISYNLLSNAFKFTPDEGKIWFNMNVDNNNQTLKFTVSDTGTGIPFEKQALIFTRFGQIQPSTTGIGLSLARELAELHKGTIVFESKPGEGSSFEVTLQTNPKLFSNDDFAPTSQAVEHQRLPIIEDDDDIPSPEKIEALNQTKVLIIEDNQEIRDYLIDYLGKHFQVEGAENGTEGLAKATEGEPDLIVCDVMMPGMDGIQVTQKLKSDFQTSHIPIVLLTALATPEYQLKGTEAGADAYITKPFSTKYLLTKITKLIEQRETLRNRYASNVTQENVILCKNDKDKLFLEKAFKIAEENMTKAEFSVDEFAKLAGYGRTIFFKKIKGITGYSPNEYIRMVRMKKALELLQTNQFTVSEVSYKVGIADPFYFSRCFKAQFGHSPSSYLKS